MTSDRPTSSEESARSHLPPIEPPLQPVRGVRRAVYLAAAALFFALSIVGIIVPGVPTVPFVLLTSFFLLRSSPALNSRLLRSRTFGPLLRDWQRHRAVRRRVKIVSVIVVATTVAVSLAAVSMSSESTSTAAMIAIASLATVGLVVIWRLPTLEE